LKKLHVLFLASWYPSRILKSNGDFIQRHAEAVALQHKVSVIHVKSDDNLDCKIEIDDKNINGIRTIIAYIKNTRNPLIKWYRFIKAYQLLLKMVMPFDIIHVNKFYPGGFFAYRLKKKKNIPYIITEHHTLYHKPYNERIGFIEKLISKIIVKNANYVCPVSDNLGEAMQAFGLEGNYFSVPNVVDTKRFIPKSKGNKIFNLLHISSMAQVKNINGLLNSIKNLENKIPNFHFYIIGGNAEDYQPKAKELGVNLEQVTFINQVPHNEVVNYFQKADAFVLFSDVENLPCVILESFSCGTPVISTDVGGISEYFPDEYGLLIQPRNEEELVNAIVKVYHSEQPDTQKMHNYVVNTFSNEHICEVFTDLYLKSLNNE
jgi:glycosyltransferase involved in cell wall biosynthesis